MSDTPTTIDRKPTKEVIEAERRFVESTQVVREVHRDTWMTDEEALRLNCINMACGVVEKPFTINKDEDVPKVEEAVLRIAEAFRTYVKGNA